MNIIRICLHFKFQPFSPDQALVAAHIADRGLFSQKMP
jgi:hypothetical protein